VAAPFHAGTAALGTGGLGWLELTKQKPGLFCWNIIGFHGNL